MYGLGRGTVDELWRESVDESQQGTGRDTGTGTGTRNGAIERSRFRCYRAFAILYGVTPGRRYMDPTAHTGLRKKTPTFEKIPTRGVAMTANGHHHIEPAVCVCVRVCVRVRVCVVHFGCYTTATWCDALSSMFGPRLRRMCSEGGADFVEPSHVHGQF